MVDIIGNKQKMYTILFPILLMFQLFKTVQPSSWIISIHHEDYKTTVY